MCARSPDPRDALTGPLPVDVGPTILALDASGAACSVAIWRSGEVAAHRYRPMTRGHAEALVPMVEDALGAAGLAMPAVSAVAVTVGPGSFTGVRAGLAAGHGFALARDLPLVGVDSFDALARAVSPGRRAGRILAVAIDTRRRDLYFKVFDASGAPLVEACVLKPEDAADCLSSAAVAVAGDGRRTLLPLLAGHDPLEVPLDAPDARHVAVIAAERLAGSALGHPPVPLYLREPEAVVPKWGGRLRA